MAVESGWFMVAVWDVQVRVYPAQRAKKARQWPWSLQQADQKQGGSAVEEAGSGSFMAAVLDVRAASMVALAFPAKGKKKALQWSQTLQQTHKKQGDSVLEGVESGCVMEAVLDVRAACPVQGVKKARQWPCSLQQARQKQRILAAEGVASGESMVGVLDVGAAWLAATACPMQKAHQWPCN